MSPTGYPPFPNSGKISQVSTLFDKLSHGYSLSLNCAHSISVRTNAEWICSLNFEEIRSFAEDLSNLDIFHLLPVVVLEALALLSEHNTAKPSVSPHNISTPFVLKNAISSFSSSTSIPRASALSNLDPGFSPATT